MPEVHPEHPTPSPSAFELWVPRWRYLYMAGRERDWIERERKHNAAIDLGSKRLDNFFDPVHSWSLRLGNRSANSFSMDYVYNPYVGIGVAQA